MIKLSRLIGGVIVANALFAGACSSSDDDSTGGASGSGGTSGGTSGAGGTSGNAGATDNAGATNNAGATDNGGAGGESLISPDCASDFASQAMGDASFKVTVTGFDNCKPIPAANTCDAKPFAGGTSPALSWTAGPAGTKSYALVLKDLAVLARTDPTNNMLYNRGYHYVIWDIPADTTSLPPDMAGGFASTAVDGALQYSKFNDYGYFGPCPNFDPTMPPMYEDTYAFTLYALPDATFTIPAPEAGIDTVRQWDDAFKTTALAITEYRGTSAAHASEPPTPPVVSPPCPTDGSDKPDGCLEP